MDAATTAAATTTTVAATATATTATAAAAAATTTTTAMFATTMFASRTPKLISFRRKIAMSLSKLVGASHGMEAAHKSKPCA